MVPVHSWGSFNPFNQVFGFNNEDEFENLVVTLEQVLIPLIRSLVLILPFVKYCTAKSWKVQIAYLATFFDVFCENL